MPRIAALLALLTAVALLASACATGAGSRDSAPEEPPATGGTLTALGTVFPLVWIMTEIAPDAEVVHLGAQGQDPHDLELTPADRALLDSADVVAHMGDLGFQPQVEDAVAGRTGATVSVRAAVGEAALMDFGDDDHDDDDDVRYDPHVWFDAGLMAGVAVAIGERLAEVDPRGAGAYRANAGALGDELEALDADLDALLSGCRHDTAIVSHEAYAYLLEPRELHQEGISGAGGHTEASPQRLAELTRRIRDGGVPAVLAEPVEGRADAEALAREAGVDLLDIDPLETTGDEGFATGYPGLLRQQAQQFALALDCG